MPELAIRMSRKPFIFLFAVVMAGILFCVSAYHYAGGESARKYFRFARLQYSSSADLYSPRPSALSRLAWELVKRTSIEADVTVAEVPPNDRRIFEYPLLVMSVGAQVPQLEPHSIRLLAEHLNSGGFLLVSSIDKEFDNSVRAFINQLFPNDKLTRISVDNVLFRTFYLLDAPFGRKATPGYVEGIERDGRILLLYAQQDVEGAWARDAFGNWNYAMETTGEKDREMAMRFGVNIVMYALCQDYKNDSVHLPFILKRRQ